MTAEETTLALIVVICFFSLIGFWWNTRITEDDMNRKNSECIVEEPIIYNEWLKFKSVLTNDSKIELNSLLEFNLSQAFYAGFTQSCKILDADFLEGDRDSFFEAIKSELLTFNKAKRKFAADTGLECKRSL